MFYPVRVLNPDLKLKKIISSEELSNIHWKKLYGFEGKRRNVSRGYRLSMKEKMDLKNKVSSPDIQSKN